jgi:hypothetical protein
MAELVLKQITGDISEEEITELNRIRSDAGLDEKLLIELRDKKRLAAYCRLMDEFDVKASWKKVEKGCSFNTEKIRVWEHVMAAAIIAGLAFLTWTLLQGIREAPYSPSGNNMAYIPDTNQEVAYPWCIIKTQAPGMQWPLAKNDVDKETNAVNDIVFTFEASDLQTILRQLEPATDYEVEYAGGIQPIVYTGVLSRNTPLDQFMQCVQTINDCTVTMEGKRIIVHRS